jgi:ribonuclease III
MPSANSLSDKSPVSPDLLAWAETELGRAFRQPKLLVQALTHSSASSDSYERLEFLGDRVLGLVMTQWLMEKHPDDTEGRLARRLAELVRRETCADVARRLNAADYIRVERSASQAGIQRSETVLGDVCEALLGALYLDGGMSAARTFIRKYWKEAVEAGGGAAPKDPKSALQEWAQGRGRPLPKYLIVGRTGPDHAPVFTIEVQVEGEPAARATGASKQDAQKQAAIAMLANVRPHHD